MSAAVGAIAILGAWLDEIAEEDGADAWLDEIAEEDGADAWLDEIAEEDGADAWLGELAEEDGAERFSSASSSQALLLPGQQQPIVNLASVSGSQRFLSLVRLARPEPTPYQ